MFAHLRGSLRISYLFRPEETDITSLKFNRFLMITEDDAKTWYRPISVERIYKILRRDKCFSQSVANIAEYYFWDALITGSHVSSRSLSPLDKYVQVSWDKYLARTTLPRVPKFAPSLICHLVRCIRNVMNLQRQRTLPRLLALMNEERERWIGTCGRWRRRLARRPRWSCEINQLMRCRASSCLRYVRAKLPDGLTFFFPLRVWRHRP